MMINLMNEVPMPRIRSILYALTYCGLSGVIGLFVAGVGGALIGALLIQEEARGPVEGFQIGGLIGVLAGVLLGVLAVRRRNRNQLD